MFIRNWGFVVIESLSNRFVYNTNWYMEGAGELVGMSALTLYYITQTHYRTTISVRRILCIYLSAVFEGGFSSEQILCPKSTKN
jgi:hypothetical protein